MRARVTADELRRQVKYDPETGLFHWIERPNGRVPAGSEAGSMNGGGYIDMGIGGRIYRASRLAWLYMTGSWPAKHIDHKDLDKTNNRWSNLREAGKSQNGANRAKFPNNTSGFKGVSWAARHRKWQAEIRAHGKRHFLGRYDTLEQAHAAYVAAATEHYGEFARAG